MNASAVTSNPVSSTPAAAPRRKRRFRWLRFLLVLVLLAVASLAIPSVFCFVAGKAISYEAYRRGGRAELGQIEGSLWEPVVFHDARWTFPTARGGTLQMETRRIEAILDLQQLFSKEGGRWFRSLLIDGISGKLELSPNPDAVDPHEVQREHRWAASPARMELRGINFDITGNEDLARFQNGHCIVSELEPGKITFEQIVLREPWLTRTFRDVSGTTAIQGSRVVIADLVLEKDLVVQAFGAEMADLAAGRVNAELQIGAFGGTIRGQARTLLAERQAGIETSLNFSSIGLAQLATFFGVSDAAGGTLDEGKFTFRGSPRNLPRASASLRVQAKNFQWESRQWDSLVLGATLLDRRVQLPELELHQGHNHLSLNGEMALPMPNTKWWQSEFSFNVAAKIANLTDLSALLLPEFKYAAGKVNIDGAVRGKEQQFNGALIVSGSDITWRNAPIEELHAALKITGNELQVANFDLLNQDDFVRGRGVVNILGAKQYWGEIRASVEDLATYAALLQPPIVPEPLAGGAMVTWRGEGSANGHSGSFTAKLRKLRSQGATGEFIHPLQADLDGAYAAGNLQFSKFALSDEQSAFTANVAVGEKTLSVQGIRLTHGADVWLEGDAVLPLSLRQAWPNVASAAILADGVPGKLNLTARKLQLREASRLTGWKWPIEGILDGTVSAEGPLTAFTGTGQLTLQNGKLPLGWNGDAISNASGTFSLEGPVLRLEKFSGQHSSGTYGVSGEVALGNLKSVSIKLAVASDAVTFPAFLGLTYPVLSADPESPGQRKTVDGLLLTSAVELQIVGSPEQARVHGVGRLLKLDLRGSPDLAPLWRERGFSPLPRPLRPNGAVWGTWPIDIHIKADNASVEPSAGQLASDVRLTGTGAAATLTGWLQITEGHALAGSQPINIELAMLHFRDGALGLPSVEVHASGTLYDLPFNGSVAGPLGAPVRVVEAMPPLTDDLALRVLSGAELPDAETDELKLQVPQALGGDAPVYDWLPIPTESPAASSELPASAATAEESAPAAAGPNPIP